GIAVPDAEVRARMSGMARSGVTDQDGTFSFVFDVPDGRYDVALEFGGDEYYTDTRLEMGGVDVTKQSLELTIRASDVAYSKNAVEVVVTAQIGSDGVAISAELSAGPSTGEL